MNLNRTNLIFITTLTIFTIFIFSTVVLAQSSKETLKGLDITAEPAGLSSSDVAADPSGNIATMVGRIANFMFAPIAIVFLLIILIGGYQWMIAKGNEERLAKAKKFILNGIWGILVIFFSWTLVIVILNALNVATNKG